MSRTPVDIRATATFESLRQSTACTLADLHSACGDEISRARLHRLLRGCGSWPRAVIRLLARYASQRLRDLRTRHILGYIYKGSAPPDNLSLGELISASVEH